MEDKELVQRILRGESSLFSVVVSRHGGGVFSRVLALLKREEWAREVTQQTFVRVYTHLSDWHGERLSPWITAIANHLALNELDKARRLNHEEGLDGHEIVADDDYSDEHERQLSRLEQAIDTLPPTDKAIIRLHYYEKQRTADIAAELKMTQNNVLVRLHRIREQLKRQINDTTHQ